MDRAKITTPFVANHLNKMRWTKCEETFLRSTDSPVQIKRPAVLILENSRIQFISLLFKGGCVLEEIRLCCGSDRNLCCVCIVPFINYRDVKRYILESDCSVCDRHFHGLCAAQRRLVRCDIVAGVLVCAWRSRGWPCLTCGVNTLTPLNTSLRVQVARCCCG